MLIFVPGVRADATYVYSGAAFTNCTVSQTIGQAIGGTYYVDGSCPAGSGITMSITLENALPDDALAYTPSEVLNFTLTAQGYSVDFPGDTVTPFTEGLDCDDCAWLWPFSTDASGNITNWGVSLEVGGLDQVIVGNSGDSFFKPECVGESGFQCYSFSNTTPGTWVETPEPSALILFCIGFLGFPVSRRMLIHKMGKRAPIPSF